MIATPRRLRAGPQRADAEVHELISATCSRKRSARSGMADPLRDDTDGSGVVPLANDRTDEAAKLAAQRWQPAGFRSSFMTKEMIISSNGHETIVAILEDDLVAEVFVERERQRGVVGNVYKGRVSKVLPGMQSSFIDVGLERDGFLTLPMCSRRSEELDRLESGDLEDDGRQPAPARLRTSTRRTARKRWRCRSHYAPSERRRSTAAAGIATRPSPRSRISCTRGRKSSCRSSRSRSGPRVPASPRT